MQLFYMSGQSMLHANCGGRVFALNDSLREIALALDSKGSYHKIDGTSDFDEKHSCIKASGHATRIEMDQKIASGDKIKLVNPETSYIQVSHNFGNGRIGNGGPTIKWRVLTLERYYLLPSKFQI